MVSWALPLPQPPPLSGALVPWCLGPYDRLSFLLSLAVWPLWDTLAPLHVAALQWNMLPALFSSDTPSSPTMPY